jgi:hypothetical protein
VNIRFLIALAAILFSASSSFATWDGRFFPTPDKPPRIGSGTNLTFQSDVVSSQIWHAVNERAWAAYKTQGLELSYEDFEGVRKREEKIQQLKDFLDPLVEAFLDNSVTQHPTNLTYYTTSELVARLGLPEDFFNKTPPRNLMSHPWGNQTNDIYGWHGLYMVITNLTQTYEGGVFFVYSRRLECSFSGLSDPVARVPQSSFLNEDIEVFDPPVIGSRFFSDGARSRSEDPTGEDSVASERSTTYTRGKTSYVSIDEAGWSTQSNIVINAINTLWEYAFGGGFDYSPAQEGGSGPEGTVDCVGGNNREPGFRENLESLVEEGQWTQAGSFFYSEHLYLEDFILPIPAQFAQPATSIFSAASILASMSCGLTFDDFDGSVLSGCPDGSDVGSVGFPTGRSASASGSIGHAVFVEWGFQYK